MTIKLLCLTTKLLCFKTEWLHKKKTQLTVFLIWVTKIHRKHSP